MNGYFAADFIGGSPGGRWIMPKEHTPIQVAAIDAGSNGLRLIIGAVDDDGRVRKVCSTREAVRLGQDVFTRGAFTEATMDAAVGAFERFRRVIDKHGVRHTRAVATSATRDAENGGELVRRIGEATGIELEVIDALEEAQLVLDAVADRVELRGGAALLIDMGGGSVEATAVRDGRALVCESYPLGPVRLLRRLEERGKGEADAELLLRPHRGAVAELIRAKLNETAPALCIGVGGNVERMAKLAAQLPARPDAGEFRPADLDALIPKLLVMPIARRIDELKMRPDRADVIVVAMMVMRQIVGEAEAPEVLVPGVDLKEGLLRRMASAVRRPGSANEPRP